MDEAILSAAFYALPESHSLKKVDENWTCPGCLRTAFESARLGKDSAVISSLVKNKASGKLICIDCSNVQGDLKTRGYSGQWQLQPEDILRIVISAPHTKHYIDEEAFQEILPLLVNSGLFKGKTTRKTRDIIKPDPLTWRDNLINNSPLLDKLVGEDWCCPACDRTKFESVMWHEASRKGKISAGFRLKLVRHHDHAASILEIIDGRFPVTIICNECNDAEGRLKSHFARIHNRWSLSPIISTR